MLVTGTGVVSMAVVIRGLTTATTGETILDAFRTVVSATDPDSLFQVMAVFGVATTLALESTIRSINAGQRNHDESDEQVHQAFVRWRAADYLRMVSSFLGGLAGILGTWFVLPVSGDRQLLGIIYLAFGAFLWNEVRRLSIATRQDERLRVEAALTLSTLKEQIRALAKHRRRDGWLWLAGTVVGVAATTAVTRLVLEPAAWFPALIVGAASTVLWAVIVYGVLETVGGNLGGQRLGPDVGAFLGAASLVVWLMLTVGTLLDAATDLRGLVGLLVALAVSAAIGLIIVRGALNTGIAAPISSLLLNRLRRTAARRLKGTGGSVVDAFGGAGT
jgi:hypothetical protein